MPGGPASSCVCQTWVREMAVRSSAHCHKLPRSTPRNITTRRRPSRIRSSSWSSLAVAATLNEQRDDECRLQPDEPRRAHDMPAVLLPEGRIVEDDLAVLG